jgi:hypothetical protein
LAEGIKCEANRRIALLNGCWSRREEEGEFMAYVPGRINKPLLKAAAPHNDLTIEIGCTETSEGWQVLTCPDVYKVTEEAGRENGCIGDRMPNNVLGKLDSTKAIFIYATFTPFVSLQIWCRRCRAGRPGFYAPL